MDTATTPSTFLGDSRSAPLFHHTARRATRAVSRLIAINEKEAHVGRRFLEDLRQLLDCVPARALHLHLQRLPCEEEPVRFWVSLERPVLALGEEELRELWEGEQAELDGILARHRHLAFSACPENRADEPSFRADARVFRTFFAERATTLTQSPRPLPSLLWETIEPLALESGPFRLRWSFKKAHLTYEEQQSLNDSSRFNLSFARSVHLSGAYKVELRLDLPQNAEPTPSLRSLTAGMHLHPADRCPESRVANLISGIEMDQLIVPSVTGQPTFSPLFKSNVSLEQRQLMSTLLDKNEGVRLGRLVQGSRVVEQPVVLPNDVRNTTTLIVGASGQGKTVTLQNLFAADIQRGDRDICLIDPTGDTAEACLSLIPKERAQDVIYFELGNPNTSHQISLNPLCTKGLEEHEKARLVEEMCDIYLSIFGNEIFGPRIQDYFRNALRTLLAYSESDSCVSPSFSQLVPLFTHPRFRKKVLRAAYPHLDPATRMFWEGTFDGQNTREEREILPYFSAKFSGLTQNLHLRQAFCSGTSFDLCEFASHPGTRRRIFIAHLAKGDVGTPAAMLAARFLMARLLAGIFRRSRQSHQDRVPLSLYMDEAQNFLMDSADELIAETRKYGLSPTLTCQFLSQTPERIRRSLVANSGAKILFRTHPEDADVLRVSDATELKRYHAFLELSDFEGSLPRRTPFVTELTQPMLSGEQRAALKEMSVLRYGRRKVEIDEEMEIMLSLGTDAS